MKLGSAETFPLLFIFWVYQYVRQRRKISRSIKEFVVNVKYVPTSTFLCRRNCSNNLDGVRFAPLFLQHILLFYAVFKPYLLAQGVKKENFFHAFTLAHQWLIVFRKKLLNKNFWGSGMSRHFQLWLFHVDLLQKDIFQVHFEDLQFCSIHVVKILFY